MNIDLASQRLNIVNDPNIISEMLSDSSVQILKAGINLLDSGAINFLNTPNVNCNRVVTFLGDTAVLLDQMYIIAEFEVGTNDLIGNGVRMNPNSILNMINAITLTTNSFSYQLNSANSYRTIPLWKNISQILNYSFDDMLLNSTIEDSLFLAGPTQISISTNSPNVPNNSLGLNLNDACFTVNQGCLISSNNLNTPTTLAKKYVKIPISLLIPLTNRLHLLSGQLNFNISFLYDESKVFSKSPDSTITKFQLNRLMLHHDLLKFSNPNPQLEVKQITSLSMKSFRQSPGVSMNLAVGNNVSNSIETSYILPLVGSQCFKLMICPQIISNNGALYSYRDYGYRNAVTVDQFDNQNADICGILSPHFNISNVQVKIGGIVLPSNIQFSYLNAIDADMYNYMYSIVQSGGLNTDGSSSRSCLPFMAYKSFFKCIIVDLENLTQNNNGNIQFDISYTISTSQPLNVTQGGDIQFGSDIFLTYATEYQNF